MSSNHLSYVLISPARNEADYIELTIRSVISQTVLPIRWVIVSDGSTDGTDEIVNRYAKDHPWIELVRLPEREIRDFRGKVLGFEAGREQLRDCTYDVIGNLDADMSFGPELFGFLMEKFSIDPNLGVAGAPFTEGKGTYDFQFSSVEHVSGACQLFRKECFEEIGGYQPMPRGGIDVVAVLTARMKGWKTRTYPEYVCFHHRGMGTAQSGKKSAWFRLGQKDYMLGRHPLWQCARSCYQMRNYPRVVGGFLLLAGYAWSALKRVRRPVSKDLMDFQRGEQMERLKRFFAGMRGSWIPEDV